MLPVDFSVTISPAGISLVQFATIAEMQEYLGIDPISVDSLDEISAIADEDLIPVLDNTDNTLKHITAADLKTYCNS